MINRWSPRVIRSCETYDGGRLLYMFDFLSIKALTRAGELMTTAVAGPSFREKIPPYFRAHSVNLCGGGKEISVNLQWG